MRPRRLDGTWRVVRRSGLLPPVGVSKRISRGAGVTRLFGIPVAPFAVRGSQLRYRFLPVVDVLSPRADGDWDGRGLLFGVEFCRFRLVRSSGGRAPARPSRRRAPARPSRGR